MRIARRFNAGNAVMHRQVPEGRPRGPAGDLRFFSAVPTGLALDFAADPALKRRAIIECPSGTSTGNLTRVNLANLLFLTLMFHASHESPTARSRRREEADPFTRSVHPPPYVGGYGAYETSGLTPRPRRPIPKAELS